MSKQKTKQLKTFMVVAIWNERDEKTGELRIEAFTSVTGFLEYYPGRSYHTLMKYISRLDEPFRDEELTLYRVEVRKRKTDEVIELKGKAIPKGIKGTKAKVMTAVKKRK